MGGFLQGERRGRGRINFCRARVRGRDGLPSVASGEWRDILSSAGGGGGEEVGCLLYREVEGEMWLVFCTERGRGRGGLFSVGEGEGETWRVACRGVRWLFFCQRGRGGDSTSKVGWAGGSLIILKRGAGEESIRIE